MELLLVFGLDVPVEATSFRETLRTLWTLMRPFTTMDSFDMLLEGIISRE